MDSLLKDPIGVKVHGASAEASGLGVLQGLDGGRDPLVKGVETQETGLGHRFLHVGVFEGVSGVGQGKTEAYARKKRKKKGVFRSF